MRRVTLWLLAAALASVADGIAFMRAPIGAPNPTIASLQVVRGEVWINRAGSQAWRVAGIRGGEMLYANDGLRTAVDGRAVLLLAQSVSLRLNEATQIVLNPPDRVAVE